MKVFLNKKVFAQLSGLGRITVNLKLYKDKHEKHTNSYLKPEDVLGSINYLVRVKKGCGYIICLEILFNSFLI